MQFEGAININMDAKGRLAIPVKYRDVLLKQFDGDLVLTLHKDSCLMLYTRDAWEPLRASLMALPALDKHATRLQRRIVGNAESVTLDSAGRILVSSLKREMAGLEKEVVLVGLESRFEIWAKDAWMRECQPDDDGDLSDMSPEMQRIVF